MSELPFSTMLARMTAMFLVMGAGWWMRRRAWLPAGSTASLSRISIAVAFPCLTLDQMLRTLDRAALQESVPLLVLGFLSLTLSALVGWWIAPRGAVAERRPTIAFLVAVPNWIFLPLPLAQALVGEVGTRTILLLNVPAQVLLWTLYLGLLRGSLRGAHGVRGLLTNPGLIATVVGILIALLYPACRHWHTMSSPAGILLQAMGMLGALTVPLSLLVTGAQLAETRWSHDEPHELARVLAGRLLVAPLLGVLLLEGVGRLVGLDPAIRLVACLVMAMPVAVSCGLFVERYGGDRDLAAQSILYSTLASLLTVPLLMALVGWMR